MAAADEGSTYRACRMPDFSQQPHDEQARGGNRAPWWTCRICHGMSVRVWFGLLARNRFAISPSRIPVIFGVTCASIVNTILNAVQSLLYQRRIAATAIEESPIFILGHWRSGTTYLHELMALDPALCAPTTYECFAPKHFLISAWFFTRLGWMLPKLRPMDDMPLGWDLPQEDEFALMTMGVGSPYETMAFPNHRPVRPEFVNLTALSRSARDSWEGRRQVITP